MPENKKNNEKIVLLAGLALIILVGVFTFSRPYLKNSEKKNGESGSREIIPSYPAISAKEVKEKTANKEKVSILDVRSIDDYQDAHIIDSINIPLEELAEKEVAVDPGDLVVVVGSGMDQANKGADVINKKGFQKIAVLSGGVDAWTKSAGPAVSWGDPTSFVNQSKVNFIAPEDVKKILDEKEKVYVLDVRIESQFSSRLPGAVNIPFVSLEKRRSEMPVNQEIIVYGDTEFEGFQGGVRLYDLGILSASVLRGGFVGWKEKGFPISQ